jgi:hypothetical protein
MHPFSGLSLRQGNMCYRTEKTSTFFVGMRQFLTQSLLSEVLIDNFGAWCDFNTGEGFHVEDTTALKSCL